MFTIRFPRPSFATFAAILVSSLSSPAQESASADISKLKSLSLEEILQIKVPTVFGASKHEQSIIDAPSSVTIVTREEIRAFGHRNLAEVLRSVRDFYVSNDRNYGYVGVRGFNRPGDYGGRILLLLDGHRVNEPSFDSAGVLNDFVMDIDLVERVEVIRGPGSALYGNNAFFAVINVISRTPGAVNGTEVSVEGDTLETFKGRLTYGKDFANGVSLLLSATGLTAEGMDFYFPEYDNATYGDGLVHGLDGERVANATAKLSYKEFTLQAAYSWREKDVPTASFDTAFKDARYYSLDERAFIRLGYVREFDNGLEVRASAAWDHYSYEGDYPEEGLEGTDIFRDQAIAQWWSAEMQVRKLVLRTHHLTAGFEFQSNSDVRFTGFYVGQPETRTELDASRPTAGVFLQDEWKLMPKLTLTAGLRYDWIESFANTWNPRTALIYRPAEKTALKLLYGQAFRAPNGYEATYYGANSELEPEHIRSWEAVVEHSIIRDLRFSLSGFYNEVTDLISEEYDAATELYSFSNMEETTTKGTSVELEYTGYRGIMARASYTFQQTEDVTTGLQLNNSPEHMAKLNVIVPILEEKLLTGLEVQYTGPVTNARSEQVDDYFIANWNFIVRPFGPRFESSIGVYNLFDAEYGFASGPEHLQRHIPQEGRSLRLKCTYRF